MKNYHSSTVYYFMFKYFPLFFAIFSLVAIVIPYISGVKDESGNTLSFAYLFENAGMSIFLFIIYIIWKDKPAKVDMNDNFIVVKRAKENISVKWEEVDSIIQIPFCTPPLYRMSFKHTHKPVYFAFRSFFVLSIGFWSFDFTGFLKDAKLKLANIE